MSDEYLNPNEAPKTGIDTSSTEVRPASVPQSAFSSTFGSSGSRSTDRVTDEDYVLSDSRELNIEGACNVPVHATPHGHSFAVLVPKRVIPSHAREDVLEVWVERALDKRNVLLYTTHLPGYKKAYLDVFQLKPTY